MLRTAILSLVAFAVATQAPCADAAGNCVARAGRPMAERGTTCYEFFNNQVTWIDARKQCHQYGASLVSVTDDDLQRWLEAAVEETLPGQVGVWIGLNDRREEGTYIWDNVYGSGQRALYFNWNPGEPNDDYLGQDCVYMDKTLKWQWDDVECALQFCVYSFVCEFGTSNTYAGFTALPDINRESAVEQVKDKGGAVYIVVGVVVLMTIAASILSVMWCRHRRQLNHATSKGARDTFTVQAACKRWNNSTAAEPHCPTPRTGHAALASLCSIDRQTDRPTRHMAEYAKCISNDEHHLYSQLEQPLLRCDSALE